MYALYTYNIGKNVAEKNTTKDAAIKDMSVSNNVSVK